MKLFIVLLAATLTLCSYPPQYAAATTGSNALQVLEDSVQHLKMIAAVQYLENTDKMQQLKEYLVLLQAQILIKKSINKNEKNNTATAGRWGFPAQKQSNNNRVAVCCGAARLRSNQ